MPKRPQTSLNANKAIEHDKGRQAMVVIQALQEYGPSTGEELERRGFKHKSSSARLGELRDSGCIRPTGEIRRTEAASAEVYEVTPAASLERYLAFMGEKRKFDKAYNIALKALLKAREAYQAAKLVNAPRAVWEPLAATFLRAGIFPAEARDDPTPRYSSP